MSWSERQLAAITARDSNLLVAAAAGSGKTSVLVERIIRRITDPLRPVDVDRILVLTFTNAAAAEMRGRIGAALNLELAKDASGQAERQSILLNASAISTIHAFCQNVVRQNFHLVELDPQFRIAGEAENRLLQAEVLESLFEKQYSDGNGAFLDLVDHYGSDHSDEPLYELVLGLHEFACSHPWPTLWLENLPQPFCLPAGTQLDDTPWSGILRNQFILEWQQGLDTLENLAQAALQPGNPAAYVATFASDSLVLTELITAAGVSWERLRAALDICTFEKIAAAPKGCSEAIRKHFQGARNNIKKKVTTIQKLYFCRSAEELLEDLRAIAPIVQALANLVISFGQEFTKAKKEKNLLDFADLEHYCLQILLEAGSSPADIRPSAVAQALRDKFAEVMIDEYQDTNGVQETILNLVKRTDNLFMVGDVKQSIYRFRQAEPELFLAKYREYPLRGSSYSRIDLSQNFRSRPSIIHAVNFLFSQIMTPRVAEMEYGEAESLNPGLEYPPSEQPLLTGAVELYILDKSEGNDDTPAEGAEAPEAEDTEDGSNSAAEDMPQEDEKGFKLEARLIAQRLAGLMASGCQVYDKGAGGYRTIAWRDIVILLRAPSTKAAILLEILREAGIPSYADVEAGYFRETEIQVMMSLLSIIDNPRQDIPLAGVLRSPIGGFTAAELAEVKLSEPAGNLWTALQATARIALDNEQHNLALKVSKFQEQFEHWRDLARRKGVPELVSQIYRDTGYYDYVGGMVGGLFRQANLRALYDRARQYERTNFRGLFRFLRFIESMQDQGSDLAVARALGEGEDVVRIMSIHKSKGLEFPVVVVADLGKEFNLADSRKTILCHKQLGVGPYVTCADPQYRYPTIARQAIACQLIAEAKAEELRVLYVALTRAREKLILVGTVKKLADKAAAWAHLAERRAIPLPDSLLAGAKSYLDWIGPAVVRHPAGGRKLRQLGGYEAEISPSFTADPSEWQVEFCQAEQGMLPEVTPASAVPEWEALAKLGEIAPGSGTEWVEEILGWQYPHLPSVGKPAKLTVTEIKRRFDQWEGEGDRPFEKPPIIARPAFLQAATGLTGAEFGTVLHSVMQHIDLRGDVTSAGLAGQLARMAEREMLLPEQVAAVDVKKLAAFFTSELGLRLRASAKVRRELPFSFLLPAERFYDDMGGSGETVFIQGVIDVLFDEEDGLVLLDYKTDHVADPAELAARYTVQLAIYAEAIEAIYNKPVKAKYLYAFHTGQAIQV